MRRLAGSKPGELSSTPRARKLVCHLGLWHLTPDNKSYIQASLQTSATSNSSNVPAIPVCFLINTRLGAPRRPTQPHGKELPIARHQASCFRRDLREWWTLRMCIEAFPWKQENDKICLDRPGTVTTLYFFNTRDWGPGLVQSTCPMKLPDGLKSHVVI